MTDADRETLQRLRAYFQRILDDNPEEPEILFAAGRRGLESFTAQAAVAALVAVEEGLRELDDYAKSFILYDRAMADLTEAFRTARPQDAEILPDASVVARWAVEEMRHLRKAEALVAGFLREVAVALAGEDWKGSLADLRAMLSAHFDEHNLIREKLARHERALGTSDWLDSAIEDAEAKGEDPFGPSRDFVARLKHGLQPPGPDDLCTTCEHPRKNHTSGRCRKHGCGCGGFAE